MGKLTCYIPLGERCNLLCIGKQIDGKIDNAVVAVDWLATADRKYALYHDPNCVLIPDVDNPDRNILSGSIWSDGVELLLSGYVKSDGECQMQAQLSTKEIPQSIAVTFSYTLTGSNNE